MTRGVCGTIVGTADLASVVNGLGNPERIRPGHHKFKAFCESLNDK
jgi:hypothetical protein